MTTVGTHILADLYGCPTQKLSRVEAVRALMLRIVEGAGFNAVGEKFYQFEPAGVTGVILLSESHFSIHTWPEKGLATADIFSCSGRQSAYKALELLREYFEPKKLKRKVVSR